MNQEQVITSLDLDTNHGFGPIPEKRKKRAAFLSVSLSFVILVVLLGCFTQRKAKLYIVTSGNLTNEQEVLTCKREDKYYVHVGIFIWSLNLIGVILGELVNRFSLMFEEYFHLHTRYSGSILRMFNACFNDISFRAVLFGTLVAFITITSTLLSQGSNYFKFEYIEIILSGVGSGTLILYLLSLDTLSRVQISSLLENNNRLVANGLAWSFYFGYLKIILPGLHRRIEEQELANILSSKTLYILMPRDCYVFGKLSDEDPNIKLIDGLAVEYETERAGKVKRLFRNVIYEINRTDEHPPLHVLAEYATPLSSLHSMSHSAQANLSPDDRDEQAKLFLRTLEMILEHPSVPEVCNKCKLVPYARSPEISLSQVLVEAVLEDKSISYSSEISLDTLDGHNQDDFNSNMKKV